MLLKILTYNIQAAIGTKAYRQYVTQIGKQVLHSKGKTKTLAAIAKFSSDYDVVCLQEVDLGGRRAGYKCQVDHLLGRSKFDYVSTQENRVVGNISRHGNAILSKFPLSDISDLKLPGTRAGRGAIMARVESPKPFYVMNVHLSLGLADQMTQIEFLASHAPSDHPLVIAGDFNCSAASRPVQALASDLSMRLLTTAEDKTYPSWSPRKDFDHMFVSQQFGVENAEVIDVRHSDHRPFGASLQH